MVLSCLFLNHQRVYLLYFSLSVTKKTPTNPQKKTHHKKKSTHVDSQLHLRASRVHKGEVFLLATSVFLSCSNEVTAILTLL